jgi:hypothetical protein
MQGKFIRQLNKIWLVSLRVRFVLTGLDPTQVRIIFLLSNITTLKIVLFNLFNIDINTESNDRMINE